MCFIQQMYKPHACHYITSVHPLLRYILCFFGLFSLHHWFTIHSNPETKHCSKNTTYVFICMYVKLVNSDAKHSKI